MTICGRLLLDAHDMRRLLCDDFDHVRHSGPLYGHTCTIIIIVIIIVWDNTDMCAIYAECYVPCGGIICGRLACGGDLAATASGTIGED